ncbi:MAG: VPS10 domain-containing protein, partial [Armatimonadota bacterium]
AIAPSNPNIVWVGTGESNNRQSSSWGNGVYRSTDAGKTWKHLGLADTHHIGRVVVHPTNPDIAWVAAGGRLWGPSEDRGVYKTVDGGQTWEKSLHIDVDTGATDIVIDPADPEHLVAATYQRRRTPFGIAGGGPGSGIHVSRDGGKTWVRSTKGLPEKDLGRIGLDIYRKDGKVLYALVESENGGSTQSPTGNGGLYRSNDGGVSWERMSGTNPRPMYFSQVRIDPNDDQKIWVLGVSPYISKDGGKTFRGEDGVASSKVHADGHALWIDPKDSRHVVLGCDGGIQVSWDYGRNWDFMNTFPLAQPYEVYYDFQNPYWVYGGLQDNGTWGAPSRTLDFGRGVTNDEWINVGGGDGFHARIDPTNPRIVYTESQNGAVRRIDPVTGESKSIRPRAPQGETYRWDWNTPFEISPHDPRKILLGANRLFISNDRGDTWRRTDDLTQKIDRTKVPVMGKPITKETLSAFDGEDGYSEIVAVAESPAKAGVLWVGVDDGALQVSQDDGKTWTNLTDRLPGVPPRTYVSRVVPSKFAAGRCYVTLDGHRSNDFKPYVFVTEDFGQTWRSIAAGIPEFHTASVIREHPRAENLLFVGTERGLWVSVDRGARWQRFGAPLPTVPIDDLQIHPRDHDLILATHARGFYILDDIGALEAVARGTATGPVSIAPPKPAVHWRLGSRKATTGDKFYIAPNPSSSGATLRYFLPKDVEEGGVQIEIRDASGKQLVRTLAGARTSAGWNTVSWDLRWPAPTVASGGGGTTAPDAGRGGQTGARGAGRGASAATPGRGQGGGRPQGGGPGGGFGGIRGTRVLPGTYEVRVVAGDALATAALSVADDPRIALADRDRKDLFDTQRRLAGAWETASAVRPRLESARRGLTTAEEKATGALKGEVEALRKSVETLLAKVAPVPARRPAGQPGDVPDFSAIQSMMASTITGRASAAAQLLEGITEPVSATRKAEAVVIEREARDARRAADRLLRGLGALNEKLKAAGIATVDDGSAD